MKVPLILLALFVLVMSLTRYKYALMPREKSMYLFFSFLVFAIMLLLIFVKPK